MSECFHPPMLHTSGPRVPVRYGSSDTVICGKCGMWKTGTIGGPPCAVWHEPPIRTERTEEDDE